SQTPPQPERRTEGGGFLASRGMGARKRGGAQGKKFTLQVATAAGSRSDQARRGRRSARPMTIPMRKAWPPLASFALGPTPSLVALPLSRRKRQAHAAAAPRGRYAEGSRPAWPAHDLGGQANLRRGVSRP